jgi:hypothetical protein
METLAAATFLKGYEWPFDSDRISGYGSSLIDLLVYREREAGRRTFLDFRQNPRGGEGVDPFSLSSLSTVARAYLDASSALEPTPIGRLAALNQPAIELFQGQGIDLGRDPLEIAVCAQHNNGGLRANIWWESNIKHLFPVGEVCGTHGVRRPGGAALNSGQVGGMRAALYIKEHGADHPWTLDKFVSTTQAQVEEVLTFCARTCGGSTGARALTPAQVIAQVQERMSRNAAHVRSRPRAESAVEEARRLLERLPGELRVRDPRSLKRAFWAADLCLTHLVYLEAIRAYLEAGGGSRGSSLVLDPSGDLPTPTLEDEWRFAVHEPGSRAAQEILEVRLGADGELNARWVPTRPIPGEDMGFEEVWREYREGRTLG